jgi:hypothetical protein
MRLKKGTTCGRAVPGRFSAVGVVWGTGQKAERHNHHGQDPCISLAFDFLFPSTWSPTIWICPPSPHHNSTRCVDAGDKCTGSAACESLALIEQVGAYALDISIREAHAILRRQSGIPCPGRHPCCASHGPAKLSFCDPGELRWCEVAITVFAIVMSSNSPRLAAWHGGGTKPPASTGV